MSYCSKCGSPLQAGVAFCSSCGTKVGAAMTPAPAAAAAAEKTYVSDNPGMRFVLPIGCTGWAIASGYCGIFSIIPFLGILLAILSIIFGIVAIVVIRHNPHKHGIARIVIGWIFSFLSLFGHAVACFSGNFQF